MKKDISRILITGASGLIGTVLLNHLPEKYTLSSLDITTAPGIESTTANITNLEDIMSAFTNMDAVIHLAADASNVSEWDSVLPNNIVGTFNVFEAARLNKVRRIVFASSNHTVGMYELDHPYSNVVRGDYDNLSPGEFPRIDHKSPVRPDGYYGVSKQYGELLGRYYHDRYGLEFACLRIGTVRAENNPLGSVRYFATLCTHRDISQLVQKCLETENLGFDVFYGVSNNTWRFWDIDHARERVGYEPLDDAEQWRYEFETSHNRPQR